MTIVECHTSFCPLELGIWSPAYYCGFWSFMFQGGGTSWGYAVPLVAVACRIGLLDSLTWACPLRLGLLSPMHLCDFWTPKL